MSGIVPRKRKREEGNFTTRKSPRFAEQKKPFKWDSSFLQKEGVTSCHKSQNPCIRFATNCCYGCRKEFEYSEMTSWSVDVDFLFVEEEFGGIKFDATDSNSNLEKKEKDVILAKRKTLLGPLSGQSEAKIKERLLYIISPTQITNRLIELGLQENKKSLGKLFRDCYKDSPEAVWKTGIKKKDLRTRSGVRIDKEECYGHDEGWKCAWDWTQREKYLNKKKEFKYRLPLAICTTIDDENIVQVCPSPNEEQNRTDFNPPYMYALEAQKSSLSKLPASSRSSRPQVVFIVKIGVPGHYTLAIVSINYKRKSIDVEYFDPSGHDNPFRTRCSCRLPPNPKFRDSWDFILTAVCAFFRYKFRDMVVMEGFTFSFILNNYINIQTSDRDEYCQTWVLLFIYFKYILNDDVNFFRRLQDIIHKEYKSAFNIPSDKYWVNKAREIIAGFEQWITKHPEEMPIKITPLRSVGEDGSTHFPLWAKRICAMSFNMQRLIQKVNDGTIQTWFRENPDCVFTFDTIERIICDPNFFVLLGN